jgi:site-specific recombinase XerD
MKNRFEHYLRALSGRCASGTVLRVRVTLGEFMKWLHNHGVGQWYEVTGDHVCAWAGWKSATVRPRTMHDYKLEVRSFFAWMYRNGYLLVNPWDDSISGKRPPYGRRRVPTVRQAKTLLEKAALHKRLGTRDRAILEVAYGCGLRRKELYGLNLSDIREDWLRVRGKGGRERVVPLGEAAKQSVMTYIAAERTKAVSFSSMHEPALFVTYYGTRLGLDSYSYVARRYGFTRTTTLHGLRHACATHMLKNGASIVVLQKMLGHAKLSSTEIYTNVDTSDLTRTIQTFHPCG